MEGERKNNEAKHTLRYLLLIAAILAVILLTACASNKQEPTAPDDAVPPYSEGLEEIETQPETLPPVKVSMPEYELTYSGELADVIITKELSDSNGLEFLVKLSKNETTIFILNFNTSEGDLVQMIPDAQGNKVPVAFQMMEIPENLSEEDADLFYMAQDAVNEIVASLKLK